MAILKSTAIREPGDPVNTSIADTNLLSGLFNKAIDEGILTTQNNINDSPYDYTSFVGDPNVLSQQQIKDYNLTTIPEYEQAGGSPYLLGQVDEGIQYQTPSYSKYSDLYNYYLSGGLDDYVEGIDPSTGIVDTSIGTGDGGGGNGGGLEPPILQTVDNLGFDKDVTPGPSGFIGLDPDMDIDPRDITDYGTYDPIATPDYSDVTTVVGPPSITEMIKPPGGGDPEMTYTKPEAPFGVHPVTGIPYEEPRTIADQNKYLGQTFAADEVDEQGNLLEKGVQKIQNLMPDFDPAKAAFKLGFNTLIGKPVSLVFDVLQGLGLEGGRSDLSDRLEEQYGMDNIGRLTSGPMKNYAVDSFFGDIGESAEKRIEDVSSVLKNKYNFTDEEIEQVKKGEYTGEKGQLFVGDQDMGKKTNLITDLEDLTNFVDEVDYLSGDPKGANTELDIATGNLTGDAALAEKIAAEQREAEKAAAEKAARDKAAKEELERARARHHDPGKGNNQGGAHGMSGRTAGGWQDL